MRRLALFALGAALLAGCGEKDMGVQVTNTSPPPESAESQIAKIQANDKMPQNAKDAAIAGIRAHAAAGR